MTNIYVSQVVVTGACDNRVSTILVTVGPAAVQSRFLPFGVFLNLVVFLHMQSFSGLAQLFLTACVHC